MTATSNEQQKTEECNVVGQTTDATDILCTYMLKNINTGIARNFHTSQI
jgi:hypothetical protein